MRWKIVPVDDDDFDALTRAELIGISVVLTHHSGEPRDEKLNVYWRARQKIQSVVEIAINSDEL